VDRREHPGLSFVLGLLSSQQRRGLEIVDLNSGSRWENLISYLRYLPAK
jgi:hypothetical protein